jgi:hypothetical protein
MAVPLIKVTVRPSGRRDVVLDRLQSPLAFDRPVGEGVETVVEHLDRDARALVSGDSPVRRRRSSKEAGST